MSSAVRPVVIVLPRSNERSMLALLPSSDTPTSRLLLPSDCGGTVRCSCCLPGDDRRPPMGDAEPPQRLQEARRSELRPIVGGQRHVRCAAPSGSRVSTPGRRSQCVCGSATMREIPSHDLPRTAVDHAHQISPAHGRPRPDLRHVRLPDLIRLGCFHAAPLFFLQARKRRERTSNPRSRITRRTRLRFTGRFSFLRNHQVGDSHTRVFLRTPPRSVHRRVDRLGCLAASFSRYRLDRLMANVAATSVAV